MAKKRWQDLIEEAKQLANEGKGYLYDQTVLLAKVFDDARFKQDMETAGTPPAVYLNNLVNHAFTSFAELYAMLKEFPRREQWSAGDLPAMRAALVDRLRSREREVNTSAAVPGGLGENEEYRDNPHRRLSWKQRYLELEEKYKLLEAKSRQQDKEINHLRQLLGQGRQKTRAA